MPCFLIIGLHFVVGPEPLLDVLEQITVLSQFDLSDGLGVALQVSVDHHLDLVALLYDCHTLAPVDRSARLLGALVVIRLRLIREGKLSSLVSESVLRGRRCQPDVVKRLSVL